MPDRRRSNDRGSPIAEKGTGEAQGEDRDDETAQGEEPWILHATPTIESRRRSFEETKSAEVDPITRGTSDQMRNHRARDEHKTGEKPRGEHAHDAWRWPIAWRVRTLRARKNRRSAR